MALKTYTAKAELIEGLKVRASARDFSVVLDEPLEQGGTNAGMNPIELRCAACAPARQSQPPYLRISMESLWMTLRLRQKAGWTRMVLAGWIRMQGQVSRRSISGS